MNVRGITVTLRAYDRLSEAFQGLLGHVIAINEAFGPGKAKQRARIKRMHTAYHRRRR